MACLNSTNVFLAAQQVLMQSDVPLKLAQAQRLWQHWQSGLLSLSSVDIDEVQAIPVPGRPVLPELVHPKQVKRRKLTTETGRAALLHAVAHIEFNAINLALDAVYRFRDMPSQYYADWLQVAAEEAYHFSLVCERMTKLGLAYGDLPAHNGLWQQACKTDHDVLVRMALVPRVLEARGLDVTPGMMERLLEVGDTESVAVLEIILRDEIDHVRKGSHWYRYCCELRYLEPEATFRQLLREVMGAPLRGPLYIEGRLKAGFTEDELLQLQQLEAKWLDEVSP